MALFSSPFFLPVTKTWDLLVTKLRALPFAVLVANARFFPRVLARVCIRRRVRMRVGVVLSKEQSMGPPRNRKDQVTHDDLNNES